MKVIMNVKENGILKLYKTLKQENVIKFTKNFTISTEQSVLLT